MNAVREGDFSVRLPLHWEGPEGRLAHIFNEIFSHNRRLAGELARVGEQSVAKARPASASRRPTARASGRAWRPRSTT